MMLHLSSSDFTPREIVQEVIGGAVYANLHGIGELARSGPRQRYLFRKRYPAPRKCIPAPKTPKSFTNPHAGRKAPNLVEIEGVWVERRWYVALRKLPGLKVSPSRCGNWLRLKFDGGEGVLLGVEKGEAAHA